jgi:hypothetical protein
MITVRIATGNTFADSDAQGYDGANQLASYANHDRRRLRVKREPDDKDKTGSQQIVLTGSDPFFFLLQKGVWQ